MKVHGLELETGTVIKNANIRSGAIFPDDEFGDEITTKGQLFFKSDEDTLYVRNDANDAWISVGKDALEGLTDVDLTGLVDGQSIAFDEASGKWIPLPVVAPEQKYLNDLADVDVSNSTMNGWVLTYNATTQQWEGLNASGVGSVSLIVDNMGVDGTFTHDNGANGVVTIDLNSENIPFEDDMGSPIGSPSEYGLVADNVRDAIIEVKEIAEQHSGNAISSIQDDISTDGTFTHNDGSLIQELTTISLNSEDLPFDDTSSPGLTADNVRDAIIEVQSNVDDVAHTTSVVTDNISVDGTVEHDDGDGNSVVLDLNSENIPFDDTDSPGLAADNVRDAIIEVQSNVDDIVSGIEDSPENGVAYVRQDADWSELMTHGTKAADVFVPHGISTGTAVPASLTMGQVAIDDRTAETIVLCAIDEQDKDGNYYNDDPGYIMDEMASGDRIRIFANDSDYIVFELTGGYGWDGTDRFYKFENCNLIENVGGATFGEGVEYNFEILTAETGNQQLLAGEMNTNWIHGNNGLDFSPAPVAASGAIAIGANARADMNESLSIGKDSNSDGLRSIAIGLDAFADAHNSIAIGEAPQGIGSYSIAIGQNATTAGTGEIAISGGNGVNATANATDSKIIILTDDAGLRVHNDGTLETSANGGTDWAGVGGGNNWINANGGSDYSTAPTASGGALAIGDDAQATSWHAIAIGNGALAPDRCVSIGQGTTTDANGGGVIIGQGASLVANDTGDGNSSIAIGQSAQATASNPGIGGNKPRIAIGHYAQAIDSNSEIIILTTNNNGVGLRVHNDGTLETSANGGTDWAGVGASGPPTNDDPSVLYQGDFMKLAGAAPNPDTPPYQWEFIDMYENDGRPEGTFSYFNDSDNEPIFGGATSLLQPTGDWDSSNFYIHITELHGRDMKAILLDLTNQPNPILSIIHDGNTYTFNAFPGGDPIYDETSYAPGVQIYLQDNHSNSTLPEVTLSPGDIMTFSIQPVGDGISPGGQYIEVYPNDVKPRVLTAGEFFEMPGIKYLAEIVEDFDNLPRTNYTLVGGGSPSVVGNGECDCIGSDGITLGNGEPNFTLSFSQYDADGNDLSEYLNTINKYDYPYIDYKGTPYELDITEDPVGPVNGAYTFVFSNIRVSENSVTIPIGDTFDFHGAIKQQARDEQIINGWMSCNNGNNFVTAPIASGDDDIAIGEEANATGGWCVAIGSESQSIAPRAVAIGIRAKAETDDAVAIGYNSKVDDLATDGIAIGNYAQSLSPDSIAIGRNADCNGTGAIGIGYNTDCSGSDYSIAIGHGAYCTSNGDYSIAIGAGAIAGTSYKILLQTDDAALRVQNDGTLETSANGGTDWAAVAVASINVSQITNDQKNAFNSVASSAITDDKIEMMEVFRQMASHIKVQEERIEALEARVNHLENI